MSFKFSSAMRVLEALRCIHRNLYAKDWVIAHPGGTEESLRAAFDALPRDEKKVSWLTRIIQYLRLCADPLF